MIDVIQVDPQAASNTYLSESRHLPCSFRKRWRQPGSFTEEGRYRLLDIKGGRVPTYGYKSKAHLGFVLQPQSLLFLIYSKLQPSTILLDDPHCYVSHLRRHCSRMRTLSWRPQRQVSRSPRVLQQEALQLLPSDSRSRRPLRTRRSQKREDHDFRDCDQDMAGWAPEVSICHLTIRSPILISKCRTAR